MKILVCFKVTPDWEKVVDTDWEGFAPGVDLRYAGRVINCFDESALELALRLRDQRAGEPVECTALTVGETPPVSIRQMLFAVGFDQVLLIPAELPEFAPAFVAARLAEQVRAGGYDLILTGRQTGFADTGSVPFLLAEWCGLPVVGQAENMFWQEEDIAVDRLYDGGRERLTIRLPAVVAVGNSPVSALRAPTLRSRLAAGGRELLRLTAAGTPGGEPPELCYARPEKAGVLWKGLGPEQAAQRAAKYWGEGADGECVSRL